MDLNYHIEEQRSYLVVKSNELIRKARFNLTLVEQKVILYLISKIKPEDEEFQWYSFSITELCRVFGFGDSGTNYKRLRDAIKALSDKSYWFDKGNGEDSLFRWIEKPTINRKTGIVRIRFDEDLKPYLIGLKQKFTAYQLENVLVMRSVYSILLYELFLSYARNDSPQEFSITVEQLKDYLYCSDNYQTYKSFRQWVLDPALNQINNYTDLQVTMTPIRKGRFINSLVFNLVIDDNAKSHWERASKRYQSLNQN